MNSEILILNMTAWRLWKMLKICYFLTCMHFCFFYFYNFTDEVMIKQYTGERISVKY